MTNRLQAQALLEGLQQRSLRICCGELTSAYHNSGLVFSVQDKEIHWSVYDTDALKSFWKTHGKSSALQLNAGIDFFSTKKQGLLLSLNHPDIHALAYRCSKAISDSLWDTVVFGLLADPALDARTHITAPFSCVTVSVGITRMRRWVHLLQSGLQWDASGDSRANILGMLPLYASDILGSGWGGYSSNLPDWAMHPEYEGHIGATESFVILHELSHAHLRHLHSEKTTTLSVMHEQEYAADECAALALLKMHGDALQVLQAAAEFFLMLHYAKTFSTQTNTYPKPHERLLALTQVLATNDAAADESIRDYVTTTMGAISKYEMRSVH